MKSLKILIFGFMLITFFIGCKKDNIKLEDSEVYSVAEIKSLFEEKINFLYEPEYNVKEEYIA